MPSPRGARAAAAALCAAALLLGTACGSRVPESAFTGRPDPAAAPPRPQAPGVDAGTVRVGIVTSATSPVGGDAFTGPRDGARAYFDRLNADGGVNGRRVEVLTCDDGGSGVGNDECVHELVDREKVFALVAGASLDYAGASFVSRRGVPDVGGQPIGTAYDTYPHLYSVYGSSAPRRGTTGWDGRLVAGTEVYRYFREEQGARRAAVVSYNQAASTRYADRITRGLRAEGYEVTEAQVDFALPNFQAVAANLRARKVQLVFDAMDANGNARLCEAMDAAGVRPRAKVTTVQSLGEGVRETYEDTPGCRDSLWATASSRPYTDTSHPEVAAFRRGMAAHARTRGTGPLSQWQLEGWAAARWLTDAMASCGDGLTRPCVERFMNRAEPYDAGGLLLPTGFTPRPRPPETGRTCLSVARWNDRDGWVPQGEMTRNCFTVPQLPYKP